MEIMDFKKISPAKITSKVKKFIAFSSIHSKELLFTIFISVFTCFSMSFVYILYSIFDAHHDLGRFQNAIIRSQETIPNNSETNIKIDSVIFSVSKSLEEIKAEAERENLHFKLAETYIDTAEVLYSNNLIGEIKQAGEKLYIENKRPIEIAGKPILITRRTPVNILPAFTIIGGMIIALPVYIFLTSTEMGQTLQAKRNRRRVKIGNDKETA